MTNLIKITTKDRRPEIISFYFRVPDINFLKFPEKSDFINLNLYNNFKAFFKKFYKNVDHIFFGLQNFSEQVFSI